MSAPIDLIIIDEDPQARLTLRQTLGRLSAIRILAETESLLYGYELVRNNRPKLVFIHLGSEPEKTLGVINRIATYFKETLIVVSGPAQTPEAQLQTLTAVMQAGAREYLTRPLGTGDITQVLQKHWSTLTADPAGDTTGRIITVFSNKGGLGKTTVAVNLALALSETVGQPVALVDLNLQLGDVATFLDIRPEQTIADIAQNIERVDADYLKSSLAKVTHGQAQLYVLADPMFVEESETITPEQIQTVLTVLRATFAYVVVDTTASFDAKTLTALDMADNILLVSIVNLPCLRSTQRVLNLFHRLKYDPQKIKLLMNRTVNNEEITDADVEETLNHPIFYKIPNNYPVVMTAVNRGIPIMAVPNGQSLYQYFLTLAQQLSGMLSKKIPTLPAQQPQEPTHVDRVKPGKSLLGQWLKR